MLTFLRLNIALELAKHNAVYEDIASKFFEVSYRVPEQTIPDIPIALHLYRRCDDIQDRRERTESLER